MKHWIALWLMLVPLLSIQAQRDESRYLVGAVPIVDSRVVFEKAFDAPTTTASTLYRVAQSVAEEMTVSKALQKNSNILRKTRIEVDNAEQHTIILKMNEWLTFKRTALALDRAQITYTVVLVAEHGKLTATIKNISYINEAQEDTPKAEIIRAENWITDEHGLNKKQTKLAKISGKFRAKTIDRVNEVFDLISQAIAHAQ